MANIVKIVLEGTDQTGAAFQSAARNAKILSSDLRGTNVAFVQLGNIASSVGANSLAGLITTFEQSSAAAAALTNHLGKSKLAVAALGTAVAAAGFKVGNTLADWLGFTGANEDKATAFNDKLSSVMRQIEAAQSTLSGDKTISAELERINEEMTKLERSVEAKGAFGGPSFLGGKAGMPAEEVEALLEKFQQLRALTIEVGEAAANKTALENRERGLELMDQLIQKTYEATNAELAQFNAEDLRHQSQLAKINELILAEGLKNNLISAETELHEAKMTEIKRVQSEKRAQIAADLAKREQQMRQATLNATASLFGNLSALAAAQGKKGFALAQGFRYAETIVNTASGVARALADYSWPFSIIVGSIVAAAGAVQLATIASAKPSGQAHAGLTSAPESGTYQLLQGERVLAPTQNADLTEFLESRGGNRNTTVTINLDGRILAQGIGQMSRDGRLEIDARSIT